MFSCVLVYRKVCVIRSFLTTTRTTTSLQRTMAGRTQKVLNVAEKNDAAKAIADVLSNGRYRRREGFSKFNKIYDFESNILNKQSSMFMTSVSGHLLALDFKGSYQKWHSCQPVALFDAAVEKYCPDQFKDIKRTLEREARQCQVLVIWTDCDREGENIGMEVIDVCKAVKPNIRVYRARFSDFTPQSITAACRNLGQPDYRSSDAVNVRSELDLRIGAAFTRFQTLRLQKIFPNVLSDQVISYGSCQFPTLGFVVERYKAIQNFIPETFHKIKVSHETEDGRVDFNWKRNRLFSHTACLVLYQIVMENPLARVVSVNSRPKSKWRPQPLETVELEKLASRKLRINAKETMKIAEKLYNQGYISYPRTETNMFSKDMDLQGLVQLQTVDQDWGGFAAGVLQRGPNPRNGTKTDNAHPPIHPTKYTDNLQGNEKRLYEFIVRHFLACLSQDAQGQETTVEIDINGEKFTAQGLMIIARNYLDVYPYDKWNAKVIPVFNQGETFQPSVIEMTQGQTGPPPLLTEADLIALMDKHGIGTDATHAEHIETIKSRMYVGVQQDGRFVPGELGMGLVEGYDAMGYEMSKPHLRAELEADLKLICEGRKDPKVVLAEQVQKYKEVFVEACAQALKLDEALGTYFGEAQPFVEQDMNPAQVSPPIRPCPQCGESMVIKTRKDGGLMLSCMGYPGCRAVVWFPAGVLEATCDEAVCTRCQPGPVHKVKFKFKRGSVPPMIPLDYVGCIGGCDETVRELFNLNYLRPQPQQQQPRGRGGAGRGQPVQPSRGGTGRGRGNGRGNGPSPPRGGGNNNGPFPPRGGGGNARGNQRGSNDRGNNRGGGNSRDFHTSNQSSMDFLGVGGSGRTPLAAVQSAGDGNAVVCICGQNARLLTVRKEGNNCGRQFYKCSRMDQPCDFFLWADDNPPSAGDSFSGGANTSYNNNNNNRSTYNARGGGGNSTFNNQRGFGGRQSHSSGDGFGGDGFDGDVPQCNCGQPSVTRTVQKEGNNKGRQFHTCAKPMGEQCGYFQWTDAPDNRAAGDSFRGDFQGATGRGQGSRGGRGRGRGHRGNSSDGDWDQENSRKRKPPKCGSCGEIGHTKRGCRNKDF
ncbi:DNA topoisomerase 3-alpha-like isoform X1 [Branchiostoma floridae x Branchiostoma belcheri]